jgi:hypothetical protein
MSIHKELLFYNIWFAAMKTLFKTIFRKLPTYTSRSGPKGLRPANPSDHIKFKILEKLNIPENNFVYTFSIHIKRRKTVSLAFTF